MARVRLVKPEVFRHEELAELPVAARYLFIGLWTIADREGRLEDRPRRIKADLFPYEDNLGEVEAALWLLHERGFIRRYQVDEKQVIWIPKFSDHQKPHPREAKSLLPPIDAPKASLRQTQGEPFHGQATPRRAVSDSRTLGLSDFRTNTLSTCVDDFTARTGFDSPEQVLAEPAKATLTAVPGSGPAADPPPAEPPPGTATNFELVPGPKPEDLLDAWNTNAAPELARVKKLSEDRRKKCRVRLKERPIDGPEGWRAVIARINATPFLLGAKGWRADFDWLIENESNALKVLEGKYSNRDPPNRKQEDADRGVMRFEGTEEERRKLEQQETERWLNG